MGPETLRKMCCDALSWNAQSNALGLRPAMGGSFVTERFVELDSLQACINKADLLCYQPEACMIFFKRSREFQKRLYLKHKLLYCYAMELKTLTFDELVKELTTGCKNWLS